MPRGVQHLERDVGDLENAAILHVDIGVVARVRLSPVHAVRVVQRNGGLVPGCHLHGGGRVGRVPVCADDGENLAIAHGGEHRGRVVARVDDDDLLVVTDNPAVGAGSSALDPRLHGDPPSSQPCMTSVGPRGDQLPWRSQRQ